MIEDLLSPWEFLKKVEELTPGEKFEYYTGLLTANRGGAKRKLAKVALLCSEWDLVSLVQKRNGVDDYTYWAIRTTKGEITPELTNQIRQLQKAR